MEILQLIWKPLAAVEGSEDYLKGSQPSTWIPWMRVLI